MIDAERAAGRLRALGALVSYSYQGTPERPQLSTVDIACTCGYKWCDVPHDDLPRVLADRENGRCSANHGAEIVASIGDQRLADLCSSAIQTMIGADDFESKGSTNTARVLFINAGRDWRLILGYLRRHPLDDPKLQARALRETEQQIQICMARAGEISRDVAEMSEGELRSMTRPIQDLSAAGLLFDSNRSKLSA